MLANNNYMFIYIYIICKTVKGKDVIDILHMHMH